MTRLHGTAGKALQRKLILIGGIVLGAGAVAAAMVAWLSPILAPLAPMPTERRLEYQRARHLFAELEALTAPSRAAVR